MLNLDFRPFSPEEVCEFSAALPLAENLPPLIAYQPPTIYPADLRCVVLSADPVGGANIQCEIFFGTATADQRSVYRPFDSLSEVKGYLLAVDDFEGMTFHALAKRGWLRGH